MLRRAICLCAAMLFLNTAALASKHYIVQSRSTTELMDESGGALLSGAEIEAIFAVRSGSLYAAGRIGDYALYGASGNRLGSERFSMIDDQGGALVFRKNALYGAMDDTGRVLLEPVWTALAANGTGGFLALDGDLDDSVADEVLYIASDGTVNRTGSYTAAGLSLFFEGRMAFVTDDGRYGCLDEKGAIAIEPRLSWIGDFEHGAAIAARGEHRGMIDKSGAWIVEPVYGWMARGAGIVAGLRPGEALDVFDETGKLLYTLHTDADCAEVVGDCVALKERDAVRLYNRLGRCIYEAELDTMLLPGIDGQIIAAQGQWGAESQWLIYPSGIASEKRFQRLLPLCGGRYAYLTMQGVEYYSKDLGSLQISWDYGSLRYGLIDSDAKTLLPAEYLEIRALGEDRLLLTTDETVIFADIDGNPIKTWPVSGATANSE